MNKDQMKELQKVYPLHIEKYKDFIPEEENQNFIRKLNSTIDYLNRIGALNDQTVKQWNTVMKWIVDEGLEEISRDELKKLYDEELQDRFDTSIEEVEKQIVYAEEQANFAKEMAEKSEEQYERLKDTDVSVLSNQLSKNERKLGSYISVTDYGAKLNGSDDTQALLDTIYQARVKNIRTIVIPGRMTINSPNKIELTNGNFKFFGTHYNISQITFTHPDGGFLVKPTNQLEAYEVHFEHLQLNGNRTCKTLLSFVNCANVYIRYCRLGATAEHLISVEDSTIFYVHDCIIDGNMVPDGQSSWSRKQKGFKFHNVFDINLFNNLFWTMDSCFDITGYFYWLEVRNCHLEQQNLVFNLMDSRIRDTEKGITPVKTLLSGYISFHDNYIYGSARTGEDGYPWNLLRYKSYNENDPQSASLKINIKNSFIWAPLKATLKDNCYMYFENMMGDCLLDFESLYTSGYNLSSNETFIVLSPVMLNNSYQAIKFKNIDFSNENPNKIINKVDYSNINSFISKSSYSGFPVAMQGVKLWNDHSPSSEGRIKYSSTGKLLYMWDSNGTIKNITSTFERAGSPVGNVVPQHTGQVCIDTTNKTAYMSVGFTNADWKQISN